MQVSVADSCPVVRSGKKWKLVGETRRRGNLVESTLGGNSHIKRGFQKGL
jgi:hypothetical protein